MEKYISPQTWGKLTCYCATCGKEIPPHTVCFEAWADGACRACCSMACARKALGVEAPPTCAYPSAETCPFLPAECAVCTYYTPQPCANYEPEAEPEAETDWTWGKQFKMDGHSVRVLWSERNCQGAPIMRQYAYWDMPEKHRDLFAAAPQTARKLKAAEATINDRDAEIRLLNGVCDRVVKAEAEADTLRDVLEMARWRAGRAAHWLDGDDHVAKCHLKESQRDIDAALGKDGA